MSSLERYIETTVGPLHDKIARLEAELAAERAKRDAAPRPAGIVRTGGGQVHGFETYADAYAYYLGLDVGNPDCPNETRVIIGTAAGRLWTWHPASSDAAPGDPAEADRDGHAATIGELQAEIERLKKQCELLCEANEVLRAAHSEPVAGSGGSELPRTTPTERREALANIAREAWFRAMDQSPSCPFSKVPTDLQEAYRQVADAVAAALETMRPAASAVRDVPAE